MVEDTDKVYESEASKENLPSIGHIEWMDLNVVEASRIKDFYCAVVGWSSSEVDIGSYSDFNINQPGTHATVAGICHERGSNANLPSQWLIYVRVANIKESIAKCEKLGGKLLNGPQRIAGSNFCVIQDPAGAILALMSE